MRLWNFQLLSLRFHYSALNLELCKDHNNSFYFMMKSKLNCKCKKLSLCHCIFVPITKLGINLSNRLKVTRRIPSISITLSTVPLDPTEPGWVVNQQDQKSATSHEVIQMLIFVTLFLHYALHFQVFKLTRRIVAILYLAQHWSQHKTHLLEFPTVTHVVKNQIKCILLNERLHDISLVQIRWPNLPCLPEHEWRVRDIATHYGRPALWPNTVLRHYDIIVLLGWTTGGLGFPFAAVFTCTRTFTERVNIMKHMSVAIWLKELGQDLLELMVVLCLVMRFIIYMYLFLKIYSINNSPFLNICMTSDTKFLVSPRVQSNLEKKI